MESSERRPACVATLTAATTVPSESLIGAASERSPSSSSWSMSDSVPSVRLLHYRSVYGHWRV
jgi:hypothetical protein